MKIVNFQLVTNFTKTSILDVRLILGSTSCSNLCADIAFTAARILGRSDIQSKSFNTLIKLIKIEFAFEN